MHDPVHKIDPLVTTQRVKSGRGSDWLVRSRSVHVRVVAGPDAGTDVSLDLPLVRFGSGEENDLVLSDRAVSRHHAVVRQTERGLELEDLHSTNGTWIGDLRISRVFLEPGVEWRIGHSLIAVCERSEERRGLITAEAALGDLVGGSPAMRELFALMRAVAPARATVLIQGETGTGKEVVARTIHALSGRPGPLAVFDCASTDREMMKSELFGHVRGAFTGALDERAGAARRAQHGTLFLDEIGELPIDLQPRLLRMLENREVQPVGSDDPVRLDVRVVAASHQDLAALARTGRFRPDLLHRLSVVKLEVPPLRERPRDIPLLVAHLSAELGLSCRLSPESLEALGRHPWPGNVRMLRNVLERAGAMVRDGTVEPRDLDLPPFDAPDAHGRLDAIERQEITSALARHKGNRTAAARALGISLATLKRRIKDYGLANS